MSCITITGSWKLKMTLAHVLKQNKWFRKLHPELQGSLLHQNYSTWVDLNFIEKIYIVYVMVLILSDLKHTCIVAATRTSVKWESLKIGFNLYYARKYPSWLFERPYLMTGINLMCASFGEIHRFPVGSVDFMQIQWIQTMTYMDFNEIHISLSDFKREYLNNERPLGTTPHISSLFTSLYMTKVSKQVNFLLLLFVPLFWILFWYYFWYNFWYCSSRIDCNACHKITCSACDVKIGNLH